MPRASSQASKATKSGFGIQEGTIKVVDARYAIVQHSKKDGTLVTPFFGLLLDYVKCDETGEADNPDDTMTKDLPIQWVGKDKENRSDDGEVLYLFDKLKFHPGKAKNADDTDPEDLGVEVGTEGNMLWAEGENATPFQDCDYIEFLTSLEKKGWKPEINDQSYAPNYIGMVFKFHTENKPLRKDAKAEDKPQTKWVVDQIFVRPYEQKAVKAGAGKKSGSAASSATGTTKSSTQTESGTSAAKSESNGHGDASSEGFSAALTKLLESPATPNKTISGKLSEGVKLNDFVRAMANEIMLVKVNGKSLAGTVQKDIINSMKTYSEEDGGWIEQNGVGVIVVDREKGEVSKIG